MEAQPTESNQLHLKALSWANWLEIEHQWDFFNVTPRQWVEAVLSINLNPTVPSSVHALFEVARAPLLYALVYYPLFTLAEDQLLRVAETAARLKCELLKAPAGVSNFKRQVDWLLDGGHIADSERVRWDALRMLRNHGSHPEHQRLEMPGPALSTLQIVADRINEMFR